MSGAGSATGVLIGPGPGSLGVAGNAMMQADDKDGSVSKEPEGQRAPRPADATQDQTPKKAHTQDHQPAIEKAAAHVPASELNPTEIPVFRGGSGMEARPIDVKLTPQGNVRPTRGISLNTDAGKLSRLAKFDRLRVFPRDSGSCNRASPATMN